MHKKVMLVIDSQQVNIFKATCNILRPPNNHFNISKFEKNQNLFYYY